MTVPETATAPPAGAPQPVAAPAWPGRLLRAELLKLRTTRTGWITVLVAAVAVLALTVLITVTAGMTFNGQSKPSTPAPSDPGTLRTIYGLPFSIASTVALALGVLAMTGEFRYQTITPSLLAAPRRVQLVVAKIGAQVVQAVLAAAALLAVGGATAMVVLAARNYGPGLAADGVLRTIVLTFPGTAVWAVVGVGVGTLIRNQVAALVTALSWHLMVEGILVLALSAIPVGRDIAPYLPGPASSAIVTDDTTNSSVHYLPWWGGSLVLLGYGLVFAAFGLITTLRRDIS